MGPRRSGRTTLLRGLQQDATSDTDYKEVLIQEDVGSLVEQYDSVELHVADR